jgi:hypothetical protein
VGERRLLLILLRPRWQVGTSTCLHYYPWGCKQQGGTTGRAVEVHVEATPAARKQTPLPGMPGTSQGGHKREATSMHALNMASSVTS